MYRSKLWTMRQYAGFGSAEATNQRFKFLLDAGQTGLSCAFDLPTQMGYDSDHPRAEGEVGKVGVAIDSLADMRLLMADLPMDKVTTSMTINATGAILLLLYELVAEEQGVPGEKIRGTIQNDILKEYIARGTYIYPPRPSMRLIVDTFAYCAANLPSWNTISISGYHIREAGSTAVQEIAFTLANGIAYVEAAIAAGQDVDAFAPRLSFFWNAHNNLFEEVAKYRAARRMWARIMTERFGAKDERSKMLRFHTQTGGSTLTAQQPENNIVRVTVQSLAAALGGTQSLHTNGFDEALGLPTTRAAKIALRTQQIVGFESGVADTVDPLAGSYFVEALTDEVEAAANDYLQRIEDMGGAVAAIEARFMQEEIESAAYSYAKAVDDGEKVVVGVNKFTDAEGEAAEVFPIDIKLQQMQIDRTRQVRAERDQAAAGPGPGRRGRDGEGRGQPPGADEGGAAGHGHAGRGRRRPAGRVRRVPARRLSPGVSVPGQGSYWPLFDLVVRTPRLELRLPREDEFAAIVAVIDQGIHDAGSMPFFVPWTDEEPGRRAQASRPVVLERTGRTGRRTSGPSTPPPSSTGARSASRTSKAAHFGAVRSVETGSWLGRAHQGQGLGREMREAILHLAFAGLGAEEALSGAFEDNAASIATSRAVGYEENGEALAHRRDGSGRTIRFRLSRQAWERAAADDIEIVGLEAASTCSPGRIGLAEPGDDHRLEVLDEREGVVEVMESGPPSPRRPASPGSPRCGPRGVPTRRGAGSSSIVRCRARPGARRIPGWRR